MRFLPLIRNLGVAALVTSTSSVPVTQAATATAAKRASVWQADFAKAQQEAKKSKRPILIHFYAEWCGPCKKMEAEVLGSNDLAKQLGNHIIAVKINADKHIALVEQYDVNSLPCDVFIDPSGRVISRSEGYQKKSDYLARIARVDAKWSQIRKQIMASDTKITLEEGTQGPQLGGPSLKSPVSGDVPAPIASDAKPAESQAPARVNKPVEGPAPSERQTPRNAAEFVGLDGYSPIVLGKDRKWVKGSPSHIAEYKGIKYWLVDSSEVAEFNIHAERYAPRLLGCDPVLLWQTDRAFQGSTQFGAFYAGQLYLFVSAESRTEFKENPERYIQSRHVLRPEEIDRDGVRRAAVEPTKTAG